MTMPRPLDSRTRENENEILQWTGEELALSISSHPPAWANSIRICETELTLKMTMTKAAGVVSLRYMC